MKPLSVNTHYIDNTNGVLDCIDVFISHYGGQAYQITIRCYDHSWTAYRGSCGFDSIEEYFIDVYFERGYIEHLVDLFLRAHKSTKKEKDWLTRIIGDICIYFKNIEATA